MSMQTATSVQQGKVYFTLKHFCYLELAMHFMRSRKLTNKKQKIFSKKQKGFRDGLAYFTPQRNKVKCITQLWSHPIPSLNFFNGMGPRLGNAEFPLFLRFFEGWSLPGHP